MAKSVSVNAKNVQETIKIEVTETKERIIIVDNTVKKEVEQQKEKSVNLGEVTANEQQSLKNDQSVIAAAATEACTYFIYKLLLKNIL